MDRLDAEIFKIECLHISGISLECCHYCGECEAWIDGEPVGEIVAKWDQETGEIEVYGRGYAKPGAANG